MIIKFLSRNTKNATPSFWWGMGGTSVALVVLFVLGICLARPEALTLAFGVAGWAVGLLIGIFLSPHKGEGGLFRAIGSYVVTFISGFVASKLAGIDTVKLIGNISSDQLKSGRALLCLSFFLIGIMQAYFIRVYLDRDRPQDQFAARNSESE